MRKYMYLLLLFVPSFMLSQSLKLIDGNTLYYHNKDKFVEIKQLEKNKYFQGYDIIDSKHILMAYNDDSESIEASVAIKVVNLETNKETLVQGLGGTGDSYFFYNKDNDLVVFGWYDGIYIFKIHNEKKDIINKNIEFIKILDCLECWIPFWVDKFTIGYTINNKLEYVDIKNFME